MIMSKKNRFSRLRSFIVIILLALSQFTLAADFDPPIASDSEWLPYHPRVNIWGYGTTPSRAFAKTDGMLPIYGDTKGFFYADTMEKYGGGKEWVASIGTGFRQILGNVLILGGYAFFDRNRVGQSNYFTMVNPGIEIYDQYWDFHINVYFPDGKQKHFRGRYFGDQIQTTDFIRFSGHEEFDRYFDIFDEVSRGGDVILGHTFPRAHNFRIFVGGYYYRYQNAGNFGGVEGGFELPLEKYVVLDVRNSYDHVAGDTFAIGVRFLLGGIPQIDKETLEDHLLDVIRRHLGTLNTGAAVRVRKVVKNTGVDGVELDKIWFFRDPTGFPFIMADGLANCTFEHPCYAPAFNQFTVTSINKLQHGAHLYFAGPAVYPIVNGAAVPGPAGVMLASHRVALYPGQTLSGRDWDFVLPAPEVSHPIIVGGIDLDDNNNVNHLTISGAGTHEAVGVYAGGTTNDTLDHVDVVDYHGSFGRLARGIEIEDSDHITLSHVRVADIYGEQGRSGFAASNGIDVPGGQGGDGQRDSYTDGVAANGAIGIEIRNSTAVAISDTTVEHVVGGRGGNGGTGGRGGDVSQPGDNTNAVGGNGAHGGTGGRGGDAVGIEIANSQVDLQNITLTNIVGGQGGVGGAGGRGGNADANNTTLDENNGRGEAGTGGNGGVGGTGGQGGMAVGIITNERSTVTANNLVFSNIVGGLGGAGGRGGNGGSANANNNAGDAVAGGGADPGKRNTLGSPGNAGNGGEGGIGGKAFGMYINESQLTMTSSTLTNIRGGQGGVGGIGGNGGDANANDNAANGTAGGANYKTHDDNLSPQLTHNGGVGGQGGTGGDSIGIFANDTATITAFNINLNNINAGQGGTGGRGGNGGNSDANGNAQNGTAGGGQLLTEGLDNQPNVAHNGGAGGIGGTGGESIGFELSNASAHVSNSSLNDIHGGRGGQGGVGGTGGSANAMNNGDSGVAGGAQHHTENISAINVRAKGGKGGAGGTGGLASVAHVDPNSNLGFIGTTINNVHGGTGGSGGVGGRGGDAKAVGNQSYGVGGGGHSKGNFNVDGGAGGRGGDGGDVESFNNADNVTAGSGGDGAMGGRGGDTFATGNSSDFNGINSDDGNKGAAGDRGNVN